MAALTRPGIIENEVELGILESYCNDLGNSIVKDVRSLRPIELRMRGTYAIDRANTVTVLEIIIDQTVNLLMANA